MDEVILGYEEVAEYVDTVCRKFINDNTDESYNVERPQGNGKK